MLRRFSLDQVKNQTNRAINTAQAFATQCRKEEEALNQAAIDMQLKASAVGTERREAEALAKALKRPQG